MFQNNAVMQSTYSQQQPVGGNVQQPSLFGNTTTPGNLFGQPQQTTLNTNPLGQPQQQGVLGQQPQQQTSIFGNPQPQIGGLQPTQQQTGLLGQTPTLGLTPQQGQQLPQQQQTGILGQNTTGILGQNNTGILGGQTNTLGGGLQAPILGQAQGQPNQVQQPQQQQQPKNYTLQQMKNEAQKHIDNLAKTIINKEKIEKNQKNLQLIEKNSLKNIQQQQQQPQQNNQGMGLGLGLVSQQQQPQNQRPIQKVDPRNHTAKVEKFYNEWNKVIQRITQKQAETLNQLNELNQLLKQQDMYNGKIEKFIVDIDEESLIDSIRQLGKDLDGLEHKIIEVVKLQEKVLGLEKEETEWDQIVNNLSECLILLEQQARDVEDQLSQAENHPKVLSR